MEINANVLGIESLVLDMERKLVRKLIDDFLTCVTMKVINRMIN